MKRLSAETTSRRAAVAAIACAGAALWLGMTLTEDLIQHRLFGAGGADLLLLSSGLRLTLLMVLGWRGAAAIAVAVLAALFFGNSAATLGYAGLLAGGWAFGPWLMQIAVRRLAGIDGLLSGLRQHHLVMLAAADSVVIYGTASIIGLFWSRGGENGALVTSVSNFVGILAFFALTFAVLRIAKRKVRLPHSP